MMEPNYKTHKDMAKIMSFSKLSIVLNGIVLFKTDINKTKRYQGQLWSIVMVNVVLKIILQHIVKTVTCLAMSIPNNPTTLISYSMC